jgi:hypothetical protein
MAVIAREYLGHQRLRWMRHDAERFRRPRPPGHKSQLHIEPELGGGTDHDVMSEIEHVDRRLALARLRLDFELLKFELGGRKAGFNPDQPRDEVGRWRNGRGSNDGPLAPNSEGIAGNSSPYDAYAAGTRGSAAYCWNQMKIDMLLCSASPLTWRRAVCRAQANERYAACLSGRPLPPLNY